MPDQLQTGILQNDLMKHYSRNCTTTKKKRPVFFWKGGFLLLTLVNSPQTSAVQTYILYHNTETF